MEELRGLRAARWIRESSGRQLDKYGPTAQMAMQDRAIAELGLVDTGLAWKAAKSGWSGPDSMREPPATRTPEFRAMMAAAERREYDVLAVGYTSRFIRDLALILHYRRVFHNLGVVIYICDDRILTSNPDDWERLVDKAKAAEISSRDQSKNVRSGYAAKRADAHDPGGQPGFGFRRDADKLLELDPDKLPVVRRVFELSAAGYTDADVATRTGLGLFTVRGMLTSPLYLGRLRDGSPAHWPAVVPEATANAAASSRARRATNTGRRADPRRPYAFDRLHCAACGRRLTGDTGYYRHRQPCPEFVAAAPASKPRRGRTNGHAYAMDTYESIVDGLLGQVTLDAGQLAAVVCYNSGVPTGPAQADLDRIARERQRALDRYVRDRDSAALDQAMAALDRDQAAFQAPKPAEPVPADVAVRYLRELPKTWAKAKGGQGRSMLATALFDRIDVLGMREATVYLSAHAVRHGLAAVLPAELRIPVSGRGERI